MAADSTTASICYINRTSIRRPSTITPFNFSEFQGVMKITSRQEAEYQQFDEKQKINNFKNLILQ